MRRAKKIIIVICILFAVVFAAAEVYIIHETGNGLIADIANAKKVVSQSTAADFRVSKAATYYYADGQLIHGSSSVDSSDYLYYDEIPENVINAFVAIEDETFWHNNGISIKGFLKAVLGYFGLTDTSGGGSTITQQVVKNTFLSQEKTLDRKVKEIFMALEMNRKYSKEEILEFYCNQVYFANGVYGIQDAAYTYFGVSADELTLSQVAYLCAIPNRPAYYDPLDNPNNAMKRRVVILQAMLDQGYITQADYDMARQEDMSLNYQSYETDAYAMTYAAHCAETYLLSTGMAEDEVAEALSSGGYKIYTSIDKTAQEALQQAVDTALRVRTDTTDDGGYNFQGALTAIDNLSGKVVAIIGGRTQASMNGIYTLNRAYQSPRQPGSSLKPLVVYTPALMAGYTADSFRQAVWSSNNDTANRVFADITPAYGISFLQAMGFEHIVDTDVTQAAALGGLTYGVTTTEMASAYCALYNEGKYVPATCITSIRNAEGDELYTDPEPTQVYDAQAARDMVDILAGVVTNGTARSLKWSDSSDVPAYGKTGTTNDCKDGWFCGMTPYYTVAVWVGCDDSQPVSGLQGASYPLTIWKQAMLSLIEQTEE